MRPLARSTVVAVLCTVLALPATAHEVPDPAIKHNARDGVVRLYGAGGPDTAFKKVAEAFTRDTGVNVEVTGGPEPTWPRKAQANADILWRTAEEDIAALLETYTVFSWNNVTPIYLRPAVIAVKKGSLKGIHGFEDLLRIIVTEGAGVANTSGTGAWEDIAGRTGRLDDVRRFRRNIVGFGKGSGPSFRMFVDKAADAWITWPDWPITNPDVADFVELSEQRRIWRDVNVVLAARCRPRGQAVPRLPQQLPRRRDHEDGGLGPLRPQRGGDFCGSSAGFLRPTVD